MERLAPTGASLTLVTSMLMVLGVGSVSTPPLATPPPSWIWKLKLNLLAPLALGAERYRRLPAWMLAAVIVRPTVTGPEPLSVNVPVPESDVILIAARLLAGESSESLNVKSAVWKVLVT